MGDPNIDEWQCALHGCAMAAKVIAQYDIPDMLDRMKRAEAVGPILDPTLYREKGQDMERDMELVEAARPLWEWAQKARETEKARSG